MPDKSDYIDILGKIGNSFVPVDKARKHQGHLYLLERLKPTRKKVIKVSKKLYVIPLEPKKVAKTKPSESTLVNNESFDPCSEIGKLQLEIIQLRKQVESLTTKNDKYEDFFENIKMFIGYEYCGTVFNIKNNLIIILDTDNTEEQNRIYDELNKLIKEINKSKPKIPLIKID